MLSRLTAPKRLLHHDLSRRIVPLALWTLVVGAGPALAAAPDLSLSLVADGFANPVLVTSAGDPRLFVVERGGRILLIDDDSDPPEVFLDLQDRVLFENNLDGLYSLAFDPDHARNGRFFVLYTDLDAQTRISRFEVGDDPDRALPESERVLLSIDQSAGVHDGNHLAFGPDGYLYVATGDSGPGRDPRCAAQTVDDFEGKILRLDVDRDTAPWAVPPTDNPFLGQGNAARWVWALGLRNPWRFSFDALGGDLWIGDPGEDAREEVDVIPAGSAGGANFGWKRLEGSLCLDDAEGCASPPPPCGDPSYVAPRLEYDNTGSDCAVISGFVYRGARIPDLVGRYVHGDFCSGKLWAARDLGGSWVQELAEPTAPQVISFGEDAEGELHLVTAPGELHRIESPPTGPATLELALDRVYGRESTGEAVVLVRRLGDASEPASLIYTTVADSATNDDDFVPRSGTLTWAPGDRESKRLVLEIVDDEQAEPEESFKIRLQSIFGATFGPRREAPVVVLGEAQKWPRAVSPTTPPSVSTRGAFGCGSTFATSRGRRGRPRR